MYYFYCTNNTITVNRAAGEDQITRSKGNGLAYLPQQCYRYMDGCYSFRRARSLYSSIPNP
jgi:hypothetical protein